MSNNTTQITSNTNNLLVAQTNISNNTAAIADNSTRLTNAENLLSSQFDEFDKVNSGVAIALALPDAYLGSDEDFAIAGGFDQFGNDIGFGMNMVARGDYGWSLGLGVGTSGGEVGSKVQARWAR